MSDANALNAAQAIVNSYGWDKQNKPPWLAELFKIEQMDRFKQLSYDQQVEFRSKFARKHLSQQPQFANANPLVQQKLLEKVAFRPPIFEDLSNPNFNIPAAQLMSDARLAKELPMHQDTLIGPDGKRRSPKANISRFLGLRSFNEQFGAGKFLVTKILDPATKGQAGRDSRLFTQYNPDAYKLTDWLRYKSGEDKDLENMSKVAQMAGGIGGFGADLATYYKLAGGGKITGAISGKLTGLAKNIASPTMSWIVKTAIPTVTKATGSGFLGAIRENVLAFENGEEMPQTFKKALITNLKYFGEYAAYDYLIGLGLSFGLPLLKLGGKAIGGMKLNSKVQKAYGMTANDLVKNIDEFRKGTLLPETFNQLSPAAKDHLTFIKNLDKYNAMPPAKLALDPFGQTIVNAGPLGAMVNRVDDAWVLRNFDDPTKAIKLNNLNEVNQRLAVKAESLIKTLDKAERSLTTTDFLVNFNGGSKIDETLDIVKRLDGTTAEGKAAINTIKNRARAKRFIPQTNRGAITAAEAIEDIKYAQSTGGFAHKYAIDLTDDIVAKIKKGKPAFSDDMAMVFKKGPGEGNALVSLRDVASFEKVQEATILAQKQINAGALGTLDELTQYNLIKQGFDGAFMDEAGNAVKSFYPSRVKIIDALVDPVTGKYGKGIATKADKMFRPIKNRSFIRSQVDINLPEAALKADDGLLVNLAGTIRGKVKPDVVKKLSKVFLSKFSDDIANITTKVTKNTEGFTFVSKTADGIQINFPGKLTSPKAQRNFIKTLFEGLAENGTPRAAGARPKVPNFDELFKLTPKRYTVAGGSYKQNLNWIKSIVDSSDGNIIKQGNRFITNFPGEASQTFNNLESLTDYLLVRNISEGHLKADLASKGLRLVKKQSGRGFEVLGKGGKVVGSGTDIPSLLDNMNYRPDKIDSALAPEVVGIVDDGRGIRFEQRLNTTSIGGSPKEIRNFLNKFQDYSEVEKIKKAYNAADGDVVIKGRNFEVRMPDKGIIEQFDNFAEAKRFLNKDWKDFDNLKRIAEKRNLDLKWNNGAYEIIGTGERIVARNLDEVSQALKAYPDPTYAPHLEGDDVYSDLKEVIDQTKDSDKFWKRLMPKVLTDPVEPVGFFRTLRQRVEPTRDWIRTSLQRTGDTDVLKAWDELETAIRIVEPEIDQGNRILRQIFTDPQTGKMLKKADLEFIGRYAHARDQGKLAEFVREFGDLSPVQEGMYNNWRKMMDGLFDKFGIDPYKYRSNYMMRVRDYVMSNPAKTINTLSTKELMQKVFPEGMPKEMKFFAEHERVNDLLTGAMEDNILTSSIRYNSQGHKKLFMNEAWRKLDTLANKKNLDHIIKFKISSYRKTIMGVNTTDAEKLIQTAGMRLMKNLGFTSPKALKAGKDIMKTFHSLYYLTSMSFRPYLAIRNLMQPFTTMALRIRGGNTTVIKAIQEVTETAEDLVPLLQKKGFIKEANPIANEILDSENLLGKLTNKGLAMFKRSDDLDRAIGYVATKNVWEEGLSKWKRGILKSPEQFQNYVGLNRFDPSVRLNVMDAFNKHGSDTALDIFANQMIEDSFFLYRKRNAPELYKGVMGSLFGQFGTYSGGYIQSMKKTFQYATAGERIASFGRLALNSAALVGAFKMLGIRSENFMPWYPAQFDGGPGFDLAITAVRSIGSDYKSQQARGELLRSIPILGSIGKKDPSISDYWSRSLPGYYQVKAIEDFITFADRGDYYTGFLALTGSPIHPDFR